MFYTSICFWNTKNVVFLSSTARWNTRNGDETSIFASSMFISSCESTCRFSFSWNQHEDRATGWKWSYPWEGTWSQLFPGYYPILPYTTIIQSIYRWHMLVYIYISGTLPRVPNFSFDNKLASLVHHPIDKVQPFITGVIILPTQRIHCYKGNPWKLL